MELTNVVTNGRGTIKLWLKMFDRNKNHILLIYASINGWIPLTVYM